MNGDRFALEDRDVEFCGIVDQPVSALWRHDVRQRLVVLVGIGEACDQRKRREFELFDLLLQRLRVIDDCVRPPGEIMIDPPPPAPPITSSVRGSTLLPGTARRRSNSNSQAVSEVSGRAAACANDSVFGLAPTIRSSTR